MSSLLLSFASQVLEDPSDNADRIAGDRGGGEQLREVLFHPERGGAHVGALVHALCDKAAQVPQTLAEMKKKKHQDK